MTPWKCDDRKKSSETSEASLDVVAKQRQSRVTISTQKKKKKKNASAASPVSMDEDGVLRSIPSCNRSIAPAGYRDLVVGF